MTVTIQKQGNAAIVTLCNPPVNAISTAVRAGLMNAVSELADDADVERIILTGDGKIFAAGADAREFDLPPVEPHLPDVITAMEKSAKPWIAAINGAALGGGLELTLGCRYRIAGKNALLGLPEVSLGLVPGAGGTQRLPRLVGIKTAVDMISTGAPKKAATALKDGVVDEIADNPVAAALEVDLADVIKNTPLCDVPCPKTDEEALSQAKVFSDRKQRQQIAPIKAIELVGATATLSFQAGMKKERETFIALRGTDQAKALRHVFFAERSAKPPREIAAETPIEVKEAVVVGGGNMGASIAYALDTAGIKATIVETDEAAASRARTNIHSLVEGARQRGKLTDAQAEEQNARIHVQTGYDGLGSADLAIEAAFEDMLVKQSVFQALEQALPAHAILASNTSYLDLNEIASSITDKHRVVGMHFFSPAHIMRLLEIVRGEATGKVALATAYSIAKRLKKIPVLAGVCDGFIGNRILSHYREIADMLLMDGALPWEIDEAMETFGYAMGPYRVQDLSGLEIAYANRKRKASTRNPNRRYIPISDRMVEEGRLGRKNGLGWYQYADGKTERDPTVEKLILEEAENAGIVRSTFSEDDIRTRLLSAMINEACKILHEGIAQNRIDIDLTVLHGYGFPRWRGGLMHFADTLGPAKVLEALRQYEKEDPIVWQVSPLLVQLAKDGKSFCDLSA